VPNNGPVRIERSALRKVPGVLPPWERREGGGHFSTKIGEQEKEERGKDKGR